MEKKTSKKTYRHHGHKAAHLGEEGTPASNLASLGLVPRLIEKERSNTNGVIRTRSNACRLVLAIAVKFI